MKDEEVNILIHVDDGALLFNNRNDLTLGSEITCEVMAKWSLTMRAGNYNKKSKTEFMLMPSTSTLSRWRNQNYATDETDEESTSTMTLNSKKVKINLDKKHDES